LAAQLQVVLAGLASTVAASLYFSAQADAGDRQSGNGRNCSRNRNDI
jgi:hypothetical protein